MASDFTTQINFLKDKRSPVERYLKLQIAAQTPQKFLERDYQRQFNAFYRVRIGTEKHASFFRALIDASTYNDIHDLIPVEAYLRVLSALKDVTGRTEASFASKIIATINGHAPVIDSVLLTHFQLQRSTPKDSDTYTHLANIYVRLKVELDRVSASDRGQSWINEADKHFKDLSGWHLVTPTKKIDLLYWASRTK